MQFPFFPRLETVPPEIQPAALPDVRPDGDLLTIERLDDGDTSGEGYRVLLYNDDHTPIDAVIEQLIKATACTPEKAAHITLEAHHKGRAVCFRGDKGKCHKVALVLREIRLQCEVDCD